MIEIENFLQMNPQVPQFSQKNTNFLIAGANPIYYLNDKSQEEQLAPLASSIDWQQVSGSIDGNIVHMISSVGETYKGYFVTDNSKVYGFTAGFIDDLGFPSGSSNVNVYNQLAIGANSLYMTSSNFSTIYKMSLPSGAWSSFGTVSSVAGPHLMEQFSDHVAISDATTAYTQPNLVKLIDPTTATPTILSAPQLNTSLGFGILQMRNFNDKYLAIAVGKVATNSITTGYPQNYIFLWDGVHNTLNYSVKVPGKFIDMKVVNSILYVAVLVAESKTCVYYLSGTQLKKVFTTQISTISSGVRAGVPCSLFDFKNYLGILLNTNSTYGLTSPILVKGSDEMGDLEFIYNYGKTLDQLVVGYDGFLYTNEYVAGGNSKFFFLPASGTYKTIIYYSQWIPVKNLKAIDIFYDSPPPSPFDTINVTIYGRGEDIITGNSTTVLNTITSTNYLNTSRTRLDVKGFTGDKVMIKMTVVPNVWQSIIRKIKLITD